MPLPDPASSRAVLIGTSEYESLPELEAVTANLAGLRNLFAAHDLWGLPPENCTVLLNCGQPGEVLAAVREAAEAARDTLVVYFAGHGLRSEDNDELYLALRTTVKDRMFTALRFDDLRRELLYSAARVASRVVLLDCCYSGAAMQGTMSATDDVAERARIEGTYLMTATASTVPALAPDGSAYTAFTGEIIDAISTGIPDGPDLLNMEKLFWHVRGRLNAKGLPIPQQRAGNNGGMISLVRNRRGVVTERGEAPRRRLTAEIPAELRFAVNVSPQDLVGVLDGLAPPERTSLLTAIAGRVDVQEIAALLEYLPYADRAAYASVLLDAALRDMPDRLVELMVTLRLLGQDTHVDDLLDKAVTLAGGQASQLAELARLLGEEHPAESRRLIASAIRAQAASAGPESLISLVGALWSAGLGEETERTLRDAEIDLGEVDALALATALNSAGRSELAVTLYLRSLDAVAALEDEEIAAIVRTARECERAEAAISLVRAAVHRRATGDQHTKFAVALWSAGLNEEADLVLDDAASRLADAELKEVASALRANGHAEAAFELYRKAAAGRPARSVVEFVDSLRASGRPVDALRVLTESATTRDPADVVGVIAELWRRNGRADVDRVFALVVKRPPGVLAQVITGILAHGIRDVALQHRDAVLRKGSPNDVLELAQALSGGGFAAMASECAVALVTGPPPGPELFASWLCQAPVEAVNSLMAVAAGLDHAYALEIARRVNEARRPDLSVGILGLIRFDTAKQLIIAFNAAGWNAGLEQFYKSKIAMSVNEVYAEYARLLRSHADADADFLLEQAAMFRPVGQLPELLDLLVKSADSAAVGVTTASVGLHREPGEIAEILNVLNLQGRRMSKCAIAILAAASARETRTVDAIVTDLNRHMLSGYARELSQMIRSRS